MPHEKSHTAEGLVRGTEPDAVCMPSPPPVPGKPHLGLSVALCTSSGLSSTGSIGYDLGVTGHWTFSVWFSFVQKNILAHCVMVMGMNCHKTKQNRHVLHWLCNSTDNRNW